MGRSITPVAMAVAMAVPIPVSVSMIPFSMTISASRLWHGENWHGGDDGAASGRKVLAMTMAMA